MAEDQMIAFGTDDNGPEVTKARREGGKTEFNPNEYADKAADLMQGKVSVHLVKE